MFLSRLIIICIALAMLAGPAFAGSKKTICHNGNTITVSKSALPAHKEHGDTVGTCPIRRPEPADKLVDKAVAMIRCLNNDNGDIVVSGSSISENKFVDPLDDLEPTSCANAVSHMMNNGYGLKQVSTGLTDGETEYLFIGKPDELAIQPIP